MKAFVLNILLLSLGTQGVIFAGNRQLYDYKECQDKLVPQKYVLLLAHTLKTKDFKKIRVLFDPEVYFSNSHDSREASFFINETKGNAMYQQRHFKAFLFDSEGLRKDQPSLAPFSEVFDEGRLSEIREYDNLCHGGESNRDEKTGKYFATYAIQTTYKGVKYTLYPRLKHGKLVISAMYFN